MERISFPPKKKSPSKLKRDMERGKRISQALATRSDNDCSNVSNVSNVSSVSQVAAVAVAVPVSTSSQLPDAVASVSEDLRSLQVGTKDVAVQVDGPVAAGTSAAAVISSTCSTQTFTVSAASSSRPCSVVSSLSSVPPDNVYSICEDAVRLSRLEEPGLLIVALRQLVRVGHPNGRRITFPSLEDIDCIQLAAANVPFTQPELLRLVQRVFVRRGRVFDIEVIYKDMVKMYGKLEFDVTRPWPQSHFHTYHP